MEPCAVSIIFDTRTFTVELADGRALVTPLVWFPVLLQATPAQRRNVRINHSGRGLHWPELDEDVSVPALLQGHGDQTHRTRE
jgi:Protein of unknown function (DUF2442)